MSATMHALTIGSVADTIEDGTRRAYSLFREFSPRSLSFEAIMQSFLLEPDLTYSIYTDHRAYSLDNDGIRLQTVLSVLADTIYTVAQLDLGLDVRTGLVMRWELDRTLRSARRLIDQLATTDIRLDPMAAVFQPWPHFGLELVAKHPLFDPENEEFF